MTDFDAELTLATLQKKYGKVFVDLEETPVKGAPGTFLPTGSVSLDRALGIGGLPVGRVIEMYGPESSGKSTLAMNVLKSAQDMYPTRAVAYLDSEMAVNKEYAKAIGLDLSKDRFIFVQESETEKVLDMAHTLAKSGVSALVVDSVASLISKREIEEAETTESRMGGNAKALSSHLRFMVGACKESTCTAIYLNQLREKLGVMFGNPETTPGGRALKFYASVRIDTRIIEHLKDKDGVEFGVKVRAKVVKNKVSAPYRVAEYGLLYGKGIDVIGDLLDTCTAAGILTKASAWYKLGGKNLANGREAAVQKLESDPELVKTLQDTLWNL